MAESKRVSDQTVHVYQSVIDDVIAKCKPEFMNEGVDESVLDELRALWEAKLVSTGVLGDANQAEAAQVLGSAAQGSRPGGQQYRTQPASLPAAAPHQYPPQFQQLQQGMTQLVQPQQRYGMPPSMPLSMPAAFAPPPAAVGVKRMLEQGGGVEPPPKREQLGQPHTGGQAGIPQQDGPADEGGAEGDEEEVEELNENDDLAAVDDEEVDEEQLKDVVLGQFDKVSRTKARWKVQLKDCIITAHGRDYLVHKANGEMNF